MLRTLWTAKGGAGCTVVTAALALLAAGAGRRVLAVDLAGDLPAALGLAEPAGPGVTDWLASDGPSGALDRLVVGARPGLAVLPRGTAHDWPEDREAELVEVVRDRVGVVLVDAGRWGGAPAAPPGARERCGRRLAAGGTSTLVVRPCYLSLRRAVADPGPPPDDAVVVLPEATVLDGSDVGRLLGVPVVAEVPLDAAVARAVDAGSVATRLPRSLAHALRGVA
jgi:hypothetical protein